MNHSFDVQIAKEYGVNEAIFIENMRFWLAKNKANGRHFYDGRTWTYNSMKAFAELFPYWSINQVRRIIENLEKLGVLLTGNYNASAYDRTNWYSLNLQLHLADLPNGNGENAKSLIDTDVNQISSSPSAQECPHEILIDLFGKNLPSLPQPRKSLWKNGKNAEAMRARWRWVMTAEYESGARKGQRMATTPQDGIDWFDRFFSYVAKSDWLTKGSWSCDLGWLMVAKNFEKVIQGNYENKAAE